MDYNLMVFIGSLMNIFVLDRQVRVFFDKRRTAFPLFALSFLFYFVLINVTFWLGFHPRTSMLIWFASRIVVSLNYEGSWKKRIIASISFTAIAGILDMTVMRLFGLYFASFFDGEVRHNFLSMTVVILITFIMALALQRFKHLKKDVIASPAILVFLFIIPLSSIVLAFFLAVTTDPTPFGGILTSSIIFGINVIVFYLHDRLAASHARSLEAALHEREKDYYYAQCRMMQESEEQTKAARHDMASHLAAIKGYAEEHKSDAIRDYTASLLGSLGKIKSLSSTGNIAFDSIINYKLKNAKADNIRLTIRTAIPPVFNIELPDAATILGNLLDNALEAVAQAEEKHITVDIEFSRQTLFIMVRNSFDGKILYADDAAKREYRIVSRKAAGGGHGLKNIDRAIEKYNGIMNITVEENVFTATVMLYISKSEDKNEAC